MHLGFKVQQWAWFQRNFPLKPRPSKIGGGMQTMLLKIRLSFLMLPLLLTGVCSAKLPSQWVAYIQDLIDKLDSPQAARSVLGNPFRSIFA